MGTFTGQIYIFSVDSLGAKDNNTHYLTLEGPGSYCRPANPYKWFVFLISFVCNHALILLTDWELGGQTEL